MPNYQYLCKQEECGYEFETHQSIKADSLTECPECHNATLIRVIHAVTALIKNEPKTLGLLAERNNQRLGTSGMQEMEAKMAERKELAKIQAREELAAKLPTGASLPPLQKNKEQWFRPGTSGPNMNLANLTPNQAEKFIKEGTL